MARWTFGLLIAASIAWSPRASPCGLLTWDNFLPDTEAENALIVWDSARHVEHFVRNAVFGKAKRPFGFLVPVPGRATLADASDNVYDAVSDQILTRHESKTVTYHAPIGCASSCDGPPPVGAPAPERTSQTGVTVLEETRVAGLDATVLAASDAAALADWVKAHGFVLRPALERWLAVYVAKKWTLVAFRFARPESSADAGAKDSLASRAVRITFETPEPIYPYLEPDDAPETVGRWLHLYVVSDAPVDGLLLDDNRRPWGARRAALSQADLRAVPSLLPGLELAPEMNWVTEFVDEATRRPATDVTFLANRALAPVPRVDYILHYEDGVPYVPIEALVGAGFCAWWLRRQKQKASERARLGAP